MTQQDPAKLSISDRLRLSSKKKDVGGLEENLANAICFVVLEKGYDLNRLLNLDVSSFMVLLDFIMEQQEEEKKQMSKMKSKSKRKR